MQQRVSKMRNSNGQPAIDMQPDLHNVTHEIGTPDSTCGQGLSPDYIEILRDVGDVLSGVIVNALAVEWKLPAYSKSRRYIHQIERNAQRGGELVKRLLRQLDPPQLSQMGIPETGELQSLPPDVIAVAAIQEPSTPSSVLDAVFARKGAHTAPAFSASGVDPCSH